DLTRVVMETDMALHIVQAGNIRSSLKVIELVEQKQCFDRLLTASDTPTGTGMMPLGTIKTLVEMCCLAKIEPERMLATSTGNVAKVYGFNSGFLRPGKDADVTIIDCAQGCVRPTALEGMSNGDIPAIAAVFSDGIPRFVKKSRNTPPPTRSLNITKNEIRAVFSDEHSHQCC
ncbi:MAG: amidohydrolase family protein, partial [Proteobacteria bacterium]|nr:amidohydrolase family protein [Pseudomonadota bacterium]